MKNKILFVFIFFVSILFFQTSYAVTDANIKIIGYVLAYDNKMIKLESGDSNIIIPRKFYMNRVAVGHRIKVELSKSELESLKINISKIKK